MSDEPRVMDNRLEMISSIKKYIHFSLTLLLNKKVHVYNKPSISYINDSGSKPRTCNLLPYCYCSNFIKIGMYELK